MSGVDADLMLSVADLMMKDFDLMMSVAVQMMVDFDQMTTCSEDRGMNAPSPYGFALGRTTIES